MNIRKSIRKASGYAMQPGLIASPRSGEHCLGLVALPWFHGARTGSIPAQLDQPSSPGEHESGKQGQRACVQGHEASPCQGVQGQGSAPATVLVTWTHLCCSLQQRQYHGGELQRVEKLVNSAWWLGD